MKPWSPPVRTVCHVPIYRTRKDGSKKLDHYSIQHFYNKQTGICRCGKKGGAWHDGKYIVGSVERFLIHS